ncbi:MAG: hypothetical protein ACOYMN_04140 [Roseimicrobium sp.]
MKPLCALFLLALTLATACGQDTAPPATPAAVPAAPVAPAPPVAPVVPPVAPVETVKPAETTAPATEAAVLPTPTAAPVPTEATFTQEDIRKIELALKRQMMLVGMGSAVLGLLLGLMIGRATAPAPKFRRY